MPRMLGASPRHRWAVCPCLQCRPARGNKGWKRDMQKAPQRAWEKRQWLAEVDAWDASCACRRGGPPGQRAVAP